MDREPEELQFLGFFGIYREAYKIISICRKLFAQIVLSLILPLSFIFLAHIQISNLLFTKIDRNEDALYTTQDGSPKQHELLQRLASEWTTYLLFKAAYLVLVLILSLLSTSAVVYSIACVYTAKDVTFRKVLSVVPKVWKRLMVTFFWAFIMLVGYNFMAIVIIVLLVLIFPTSFGLAILIIATIGYLMGLVYISVVWHLASVVSVLEESYGIAAMRKSKALIKGKAWIATAIFLKLNLSLMAVHVLFALAVVYGRRSLQLGVGARAGYAILCLVCLSILILFGLVIQTVIYFVCKSYHHESIDKSCLADHLEVYLGEYVPLTGKAVQLEQFHV